MKDSNKKQCPTDEEWNEFQERVRNNPELRRMIIAARDHKPYVPSHVKTEDITGAPTTEIKSVPEQIKKGAQDRPLSLLLFPTHENTAELIENLMAQDSEFIKKATAFIETSDNSSDIEAFKALKPTEEQKALWYEYKTALECYNKFNQIDEGKSK
jgi:hypothetical protein